MGRMYEKGDDSVAFRCYGERGIVSYFMLKVLPKDPCKFLREIVDGSGSAPFGDIRIEQVSKLTIFTEMSLGTRWGFGNPDGGLFFLVDRKPHFVFYEAKLNESYCESCKGAAYNSSIQGQLELKWRMVSSFATQVDAQSDGVQESEELARFYSDKDRFYWPLDNGLVNIRAFRCLRMGRGLKTLFRDYLCQCGTDQILFLISTNDTKSPFLDASIERALLPRTYGKAWDDTKHRFCWVSNSVIEQDSI